MKNKYSNEIYLNCFYYDNDMDDEEVACYSKKIVKCRKPHFCSSCQNEINKGDSAMRESGFLDGQGVNCYTCLNCLDKWILESGQCCELCKNNNKDDKNNYCEKCINDGYKNYIGE